MPAKPTPKSAKAGRKGSGAGLRASDPAKRAALAKGKRKRAIAKKGAGGKKGAGAKRAEGGPAIELGELAANGIAGSLFGLLERGVARQPRIARSTRGTVVLRFDEDFAPVRIRFQEGTITVEDVPDGRRGKRPDLTVSGSLPDIVHLATAPLIGGLPRPTHARGRAALARFAGGRVKIEGSPLLARRLLKLLEI